MQRLKRLPEIILSCAVHGACPDQRDTVQARELEEEAAAQRHENEELEAIEKERQRLLQEAAHLRAYLPKHAVLNARPQLEKLSAAGVL